MAAEFVDDLRLATDAETSRSEDIAWTGREKDSLLMQSFVTRQMDFRGYKTMRRGRGGGGRGGGECATARRLPVVIFVSINVSRGNRINVNSLRLIH